MRHGRTPHFAPHSQRIRNWARGAAVFSTLLFLSACATGTRTGGLTQAQVDWGQNPASTDDAGHSRSTPDSTTSANQDAGPIVIRGVTLRDTKFDFPVTINSRVLYWVDYFTGRGRPHFERYLERSEYFIPYIRPILRQKGMPEDLVYLAMIESGFNNHAKSHAKAVGPWQFISATGKRYGLMVNWWVDERRDTQKSTHAATDYLKDLYSIFHSWELAAAAYNAGEAKIGRAIQRYGTDDFWALSRHRFLRQETRDYVPKIIAAAIVAKNRDLFGFTPSGVRPGQDEVVTTEGELVKVEKRKDPLEGEPSRVETGETGSETIEAVIRREGWNAFEDGTEREWGPSAMIEVAEASEASRGVLGQRAEPSAGGDKPLARAVPMPAVNRNGEIMGAEVAEFEVESPADLLQVARAAELSYHTVKALNPEVVRWCTPPTVSTWRIRLPASVKDKFLAVYNSEGFPRKVEFLSQRARRGDTLARMARYFGLRVDPLVDLNGVSAKAVLRNGTRIILPMPNDRSRTLSSLEVRDPPERSRKWKRSSTASYTISSKQRSQARRQRYE